MVSLREEAAIEGVSPRQISRRRAKEGVSVPMPPRLEEVADMDQVLRFLEDGAGYAEVGATYGVSASVIRKRFPGYGLSHAEAVERGRMNRALRSLDKVWDMRWVN